jgi:hypothetical protein
MGDMKGDAMGDGLCCPINFHTVVECLNHAIYLRSNTGKSNADTPRSSCFGLKLSNDLAVVVFCLV